MAESAIKENESDTVEAPFEEGEVQAGNPLPMGVHINTETALISFCSAVTRLVFAWSPIKMLAIRLQPKSLIWIRRVIAPVTFGMCGCGAFPRVNSMAIASKDPINRSKAIASTRMGDVPEVDIEFLLSSETPVGLGEPVTTVVAPAIGNAIFAASGAGLRHLPIRPEAVRQALAQRS